MELETVSDLLLMAVECGYKREIHFHEFYEAEEELKSDFPMRKISPWNVYKQFIAYSVRENEKLFIYGIKKAWWKNPTEIRNKSHTKYEI